ncbi:MAG: hypothetical protein Kow00127_24340 [Bacteroidales bacterium]
MKTLIICVLLLVPGLFGRPPVDYHPVSLERTLRKTFGLTSTELVPEAALNSGLTTEGGWFSVIAESHVKGHNLYIYIGRVNSCRAGGCSLPGFDPSEASDPEYFDYFVIFDHQAVVRNVRVFNYQATHGHEITVRGWLKQFVGYRAPQPLKPGYDIDAVSGATVSVNALTDDIKVRAAELLDFLAIKSLEFPPAQ